jgi:hypothetical protein
MSMIGSAVATRRSFVKLPGRHARSINPLREPPLASRPLVLTSEAAAVGAYAARNWRSSAGLAAESCSAELASQVQPLQLDTGDSHACSSDSGIRIAAGSAPHGILRSGRDWPPSCI